MTRKKVALGAAFVIAVALTVAGVLAVITSTRTIPSSGTISGVNVGVYTDDTYATKLTSISWGTITNGSSNNYDIYVRNDGKSLSMKLSLSNSSWIPSDANTYMNLTWNREGTVLAPAGTTTATLTLTVDPTFTNGTDFSVNVLIIGTEQ